MKSRIIQEKIKQTVQPSITEHTFNLVKNRQGFFPIGGDITCTTPDLDGNKIRQLLKHLPENTVLVVTCVTIEED